MSSTYLFPENPSPYVRAYKKLYDALNAWSIELIMDCVADDFVQILLPKSLNKPPSTRAQFETMMVNFLIPTFKDFKVTVYDIIESGNTLIVHASPTANFAATGADWSMEYILILEYTPASGPDDIPKVVRLREFLDSQAMAKTEEVVAGIMKGTSS